MSDARCASADRRAGVEACVSADTKSADLQTDVDTFLAGRPHLRADVKGKCHGVSRELAAFLRKRGHKGARAVEAVGLREPLPADAHPEWLATPSEYLYHVAVLVGPHLVDVTGSQFGEAYAAHVTPYADFKDKWTRVRVFGANAEGGAGPWTRTRRRRRQ